MPLPALSPCALLVAAYASRVAGALLLLMSLLFLVLPRRAPGWRVPPPCPGLPGSWALLPLGEGESQGHRHLCYDWGCWVCQCHCCWGEQSHRCFCGWRALGHRPHCCCCPVPCGRGCHCSREAGVMCAASPTATGFSGTVGSAATVWGAVGRSRDLRHHLCCFPGSSSSMCPIPPICRCTDVWDSLASWGIGQKHLCWVTVVLPVIGWIGETKGASHAATMLMSELCLFTLSNLSVLSFLTSEVCNILKKHFPYLTS